MGTLHQEENISVIEKNWGWFILSRRLLVGGCKFIFSGNYRKRIFEVSFLIIDI
jgi:hypothetical protein